MTTTSREFRETVAARVREDPAHGQALLGEAVQLFVRSEACVLSACDCRVRLQGTHDQSVREGRVRSSIRGAISEEERDGEIFGSEHEVVQRSWFANREQGVYVLSAGKPAERVPRVHSPHARFAHASRNSAGVSPTSRATSLSRMGDKSRPAWNGSVVRRPSG